MALKSKPLTTEPSAYQRAVEWQLGLPFDPSNQVTLLRNGVRIFPAMLRAIEEAEHSIDFLTFVYWTGDIAVRTASALAQAAHRGVRVRVLLDGYGSHPMDASLVAQMRAAGVEVRIFRPPRTWWRIRRAEHRTHRKILVCDSRVGFTGGVGIAEEWEGDARNPDEWRDTHLEVEGPAVQGFEAAFLGNWAEAGGDATADVHHYPVPDESGSVCCQLIRGTASVGWSSIAMLVRTLIAVARRRIRITTAYFAPDPKVLSLLQEAVKRGVEVEVMCPGPHHDERLSQLSGEAIYEDVLEAGIHLWNYQRTMLHAKVVTVDGVLSVVGSPNFNERSMRKDDEACLVMVDRDITDALDRDFDRDLESAERIDLERWRQRPWNQKAKEWMVRTLLHHQV